MIIYKATNAINNKFYIGLTKSNIKTPIGRHKYRSKKNTNYFYNSIRNYGFENFHFEVIDSDATSYDHLKQLEIWYIEHLKPEYNTTKGGDGTLGLIPSDEHKRKISESNKGKHSSKETGKKISRALKGRTMSLEQRELLSEIGKTRVHSEKTRDKMSSSHIGKSKKPFSDEHKERLSTSHKGQVAWNKGIKCKEETKQKLRDFYKKKREQKQLLLKDVL